MVEEATMVAEAAEEAMTMKKATEEAKMATEMVEANTSEAAMMFVHCYGCQSHNSMCLLH